MMGKVLIADDDPKLRDMLRFVLEGQNIGTICCDNGRDVLKTIRSQKSLKLILMDVLMPKLNGIETIKKIKSDVNSPMIPIVLMTGVFDEIALKTQLKGITDDFDVIFKPLNLEMIEKVIEKHFGTAEKISYIFPETFAQKPSMRKRLDLQSFNPVVSNTNRQYRFYFSMKGSLEEICPGQIFLYLANNAGRIEIMFEDEETEGHLLIEDGSIVSFYSADPKAHEEFAWTKKVALKIGQIAGSDRVDPHPWISGYKSTPLTRFLFKVIFKSKGFYHLSAPEKCKDQWQKTVSIPIKEVIKQILNGPYSEPMVKKIFPRLTIPISISEYVQAAPGALDLLESQRRLLRLCDQRKHLKDVVNQCELREQKALDYLLGLALLGAICPEKTIKNQDEKQDSQELLLPAKKEDIRATTIATDKLSHEDRLEVLYEYAKTAHYYSFLGVDRGAEIETIKQSINELMFYLETELQNTRISKEAELQRRVCALALEEASVIFLKKSNKKLFDQMDLETIWGLKKQFAAKYLDLAKADSIEGPTVKSIAEYKVAWRLDPSNMEVIEELLELLIQTSDGLLLVHDYVRDGLRKFPENLRIHLIAGQYYLKISKQARAIKEFKMVLEKDPENLEAMQYLLEFPDEAKEIFGL